jgi:hypothetical protein
MEYTKITQKSNPFPKILRSPEILVLLSLRGHVYVPELNGRVDEQGQQEWGLKTAKLVGPVGLEPTTNGL